LSFLPYNSEEYVLLVAARSFGLLFVLRIVDLMLGRADIVATARVAEAVRKVGADARARRLLGLRPICVEAGDDLVDAHQMVNGWAARDCAGPHAALEEAWREAVRYARQNVCLLEDIAELDAIAVSLLPLGDRVGAENNRVAVVAVRLCDGGLESGEEGVLHVPHDGAPHAPAAAVKPLLVDDALALDNEAAEGIDVVGEHLGCCDIVKKTSCEIVTDVCV